MDVCASCHQPLSGRFCSNCGEEVLDPRHLTVRHFFTHTLVHGLFELDGKIWRTLRQLIFHPGFLSAEFAAGRRKPYIAPLRLLLTAILLYALLMRVGNLQVSLFLGPVRLSAAPLTVAENAGIAETVERIDRFGLLKNLLAEKMKSVDISAEAVRERFHQHLEKVAEPLSFANVLLLALALYAFFSRRRRLFVEHAAFSMHFMTFVLLSSLMFALVPLLMERGWNAVALPLILIGIVGQFVYLAVAIRRFYSRSVPVAVAAAALLYVLNSAFMTAVQLAGGALALLRLSPH